MAKLSSVLFLAGVLVQGAAACGGSDTAPTTGGDAGAVVPPPSGSDGGSAANDAGGGGDGAAGGEAGTAPVDDPAQDGPNAIVESDLTVTSKTGDSLALHVAAPVGVGPFPVVFLAAGYLLPTSQYVGYVKRLATHGIVGITVGMPQDGKLQSKDARNLQSALDWAAAPGASLTGVIDATRAGVMGHSRGGKAAVLAGVYDARFGAVLGLDPVDSKAPFSTCDATECPDASEAIAALEVPSGFLGETIDGAGLFQACAPPADNFRTFFTSAPAPSFAVTIEGAAHMSFLGDLPSCGGICRACQTATRPSTEVTALAYAYTAAFFRRHLRGQTAYDAYLTGAEARSRYVTTGVATLDVT